MSNNGETGFYKVTTVTVWRRTDDHMVTVVGYGERVGDGHTNVVFRPVKPRADPRGEWYSSTKELLAAYPGAHADESTTHWHQAEPDWTQRADGKKGD